MHEAAIAQNILDVVREHIEDVGGEARLRVVHLRVGRLTAVVPDNLRFMFEVLTGDTPLAGARLEIEELPLRLRCRACGLGFEPEDVCFRCERCSAADVEITQGRELLIESLEVG